MEVILKTLHYFSILFAGGVTVGSGVIQAAYMKAGEAPPLYIGKAFALLGYIGLGSIVTLWITGIGLTHLIYGGFAINGAFHAKLLGAAIVLFISGLCQPACVPGDQGQTPAKRGPDEAPCSGWAGRSGTRHWRSGSRLFHLIRRQ